MKIGDAREFWKAYQTGQGSADHTDFQVFEEVIQPLIDYARRESSEGTIMRAALVEISIWWETPNPTSGQSEMAKFALERVSEGTRNDN